MILFPVGSDGKKPPYGGNGKTRIVLHNKAKMVEKAEFTQRK